MKKWCAIIGVAIVLILAVVYTVHDFIANETLRYFTDKPHRLFYVAGIAIAGGLAALLFDRLSMRARRKVRLFTVGSAAGCVTFFVGYFLFQFVRFSSQLAGSEDRHLFISVPVWLGVVAALLWFECHRVFNSPVEDDHAVP
jgi:hypothetical protein